MNSLIYQYLEKIFNKKSNNIKSNTSLQYHTLRLLNIVTNVTYINKIYMICILYNIILVYLLLITKPL